MKLLIFIFFLFSCLAAHAQENAVQENEPPKAGSFRKPLEDARKPVNPASQVKLTFDDGCGDPLADTQAYGFRNGKAIAVTDDNKIIVKIARAERVRSEKYENPDDVKRLQQPQLLTVSLVGIDETVNQPAIKRFLLDNVLDRDVTVIGNPRKDGDKNMDALVRLTSGETTGEVSRLLLESGIAKFKEFQLTNLVPARSACELKKAETKAKEEKTGIWTN